MCAVNIRKQAAGHSVLLRTEHAHDNKPIMQWAFLASTAQIVQQVLTIVSRNTHKDYWKLLSLIIIKLVSMYLASITYEFNSVSPENRLRRPRGEVEVQLYSFFNLGARWGWVVNATPRPLYPRGRPGTRCIGGWVGAIAGLYGFGKSCLHRDSIPGPSSP